MKCGKCGRQIKLYARTLCRSCYRYECAHRMLGRWPLTREPAPARPARKHSSRREELLDEVPFFLSTGMSYSETANRLGLRLESLARRFADYRRAGLTDLVIPYKETGNA